MPRRLKKVPPIPAATSKIPNTMRIRQPFAKQPIPRFGGGSTRAFIFVIPCRSWPAHRSVSHRELRNPSARLTRCNHRLINAGWNLRRPALNTRRFVGTFNHARSGEIACYRGEGRGRRRKRSTARPRALFPSVSSISNSTPAFPMLAMSRSASPARRLSS